MSPWIFRRRRVLARSWRRALVLGHSFTFDELVERIQHHRRRPMKLIEVPELAEHDGALCGLWLATEDHDLVLHAPSDSRLHQQQFILHELAHMILRHDLSEMVFTPRTLLPHIGHHGVVKALARDTIDDAYELEAEALADELATAIRLAARPSSKFLNVFG